LEKRTWLLVSVNDDLCFEEPMATVFTDEGNERENTLLLQKHHQDNSGILQYHSDIKELELASTHSQPYFDKQTGDFNARHLL